MTNAEKSVLLGFLTEIEDLRALVQSLVAQTQHLGKPASFESAKNTAKQGNRKHFDEVRKQIEKLA
jgi:hypothetical protein